MNVELTKVEKKVLRSILSQTWDSFGVAEEAYVDDADEVKAFETLMDKLDKLVKQA